MSERGGATTQSGILYQNSIAALYLGRLCDATARPQSHMVTRVRVEAPTKVDDIVVTFADQHKIYIQAKETVAKGSKVWRDLWHDFEEQYRSPGFRRDRDRLNLPLGIWDSQHRELEELCRRAEESHDYDEWQARLTQSQAKLLDEIRPHLSLELLSLEELRKFFGRVKVERWSLDHIERDLLPSWMPQTNKSPYVLFRLLRDRVGGKARLRGQFTSHQLREALLDETPDLVFATPSEIESLRQAMGRCGALLHQHKSTIGSTGYHIERPIVTDIVDWLQEEGGDDKSVSMLLDQAGTGKTVVMRDVLAEIEARNIDTLAIKADQQFSNVSNLSELQDRLGLPEPIEQIVGRLSRLGRVVVLIDQIDALSLSLAHDQPALDIALDLLARIRRIPNVRIVISCRVFDRSSDPRLKQIDIARQFPLSTLSEKRLQSVLATLDVDAQALTEATRSLLRLPLHLDLFAMIVEENEGSAEKIRGISSLQELYALIWEHVVLKRQAGSPPVDQRIQVLNLLTEYMNREQRTSAPRSLLQHSDTAILLRAADWLASMGILVPSRTGWTFLHQTFFDYCYARHFVEQGLDIVEAILTSNQDIFERPKLLRVLEYLRGYDPQRYLRDLQRLMNTQDLRFHLYDLLLRWFGSQPNPTEDEWLFAQQMLLDPELKTSLLNVMAGNVAWFDRLRPRVKDWLENGDNEIINEQVLPYLSSLIDSSRQAEVVSLLQPYCNRSAEWNVRIHNLMSRIRSWRTVEAAELFEESFYQQQTVGQLSLFQVDEVAQAHSPIGCRLIRFLFDLALEAHLHQGKQRKEALGDDDVYSVSSSFLSNELRKLEGSVEDGIEAIAATEPELFVKTMFPWLKRVVRSRATPGEEQDSFMWDELSGYWYEDGRSVERAFIHAFIAAMIKLARTKPAVFQTIADRLSALPYVTPQQLMSHIYRAVPQIYAKDALKFLLGDRRRLDLGDREQYDTRQVVKAIYPYLTDVQRSQLEAHILSYTPIWKALGVDALRRRGIEQFRILLSIPERYLTARGKQKLRELRHKFPDVTISEMAPRFGGGGVVGSPIAREIASKMSDANWLRAMQKYQGSFEHKDFLKGGARQLSEILSGLVKENPGRFRRLFKKVPDDIDDPYVTAFIKGFADSEAPAEWLFEAIARFAPQDDRSIKRAIAWAVGKRAGDEVPDEILQMLNAWVYTPVGEDEWWWAKGDDHGDAYSSYLNSDRGSAFGTLMRVFDKQASDKALERKWELVEHAASDPSTALRAGAIRELTYMIRHDRQRAIALFERLMDGHAPLYRSRFVREFIYWALFRNFLRLRPFIVAMMGHQMEEVQQRGAELACISALSAVAMESEEARLAARELAEKTLTGPPEWRRGAAHIYARNITNKSMDICVEKLIILLDDEDEEVQSHIDNIFFSLRAEHFLTLRNFIEAYVNFRGDGLNHYFAKYLWEHGSLDPEWSLSLVHRVLAGSGKPTRARSGYEELIRLVLRIYTSSLTTEELKEEAMEAFDELMKIASGAAHKVLSELDRR